MYSVMEACNNGDAIRIEVLRNCKLNLMFSYRTVKYMI